MSAATATSTLTLLEEKSGVSRKLSTFDAVVMGVHCISLSSSGLLVFASVTSAWPGASLIGVLAVGAVMSAIHAYTYAAIGSLYPRQGADYIAATKAFGRRIGFYASWTLIISSAFVAGALIVFIPQSAIPALFQPMKLLFGSSSAESVANWASSPLGCSVIGTVFLFVTVALMLLHRETTLRILSVGFFGGLLAWGLILAALYFVTPTQFEAQWVNAIRGSGSALSFSSRVHLAESLGMSLNQNTLTMTLAGLVMAFWIYYGYYIPTFFSAEVVHGKKGWTLPVAAWVSIGVTFGVFALGALFLQRIAPSPWIAAEGFLFNNASANTRAYPWITFYAAVAWPKLPVMLFIAFAWVYTLVNLAQTYFYYCSRVMQAWCFFNVLPEKAAIAAKDYLPRPLLIGVALLAEVGVIDASFKGPISSQLAFVFIAILTQLPAVLAVTFIPFTNRSKFLLSPHFVQLKILRFPVITLIGCITTIYLLWMLYASFKYPAAGLTDPKHNLTLLAIIIAVGVIFFEIRTVVLRKHNKTVGYLPGA